MTMSARMRIKSCGLLALLFLSSATMLWLFWRYPLGTGIATIAVLGGFGVLIRLARAMDTELADLEPGKQGA